MTKYQYTEGQTYLSESTPITVSRIPSGKYKINASYGELLGELLFTATPGTQQITLTVKEPVYSIIYDKSLASDPEACLTYAGLCTGFTPMSNPNNGNCDEGSWAEGNGTIFDAIEVGYLNGTTWTKFNKSAVTGSTSYDCFTRIPKIYQKVTDLGNNKVQLDLALEPFNGASLHPSFVRSGTELNHLYVGRFLAHNNSSTLYSYTAQTPTGSVTRANFRTYARNRGTAYSLMKYYDWDLVNKLYLLAFKNFDSQTALGPGLTNGSETTTGGTNGNSWMYDNGSATTSMCFLGLEDWWGNYFQFIDDFYGNGGVYYAGNNTTPTDNTANKTVIASGLTSSGYYLTCQGTADGFFMAETSGGSTTTGLCDYQYYDSGQTLGTVGGGYHYGSYAGAFILRADFQLSYSSSNVSARLTYVD